MTKIYIYLNQEDKNKIVKQAQAKQLSLSTYVNIIANNYYIFVNNEKTKNYINKGNQRIMLKLRNEHKNKFSDKNVTNAVYLFIHPQEIKKIYDAEFNLTKLNRKIQSQADKTIDPNWNLNQTIRQLAIANKLLGVKTK